jgi:hypothetical protein
MILKACAQPIPVRVRPVRRKRSRAEVAAGIAQAKEMAAAKRERKERFESGGDCPVAAV